MVNDVTLAKMTGKRRRGRPRPRWVDTTPEMLPQMLSGVGHDSTAEGDKVDRAKRHYQTTQSNVVIRDVTISV